MSLSRNPQHDGGHPDGESPPSAGSFVEAAIALVSRRWRLALSVWILVMATAVLVLWMIPRQYQSMARFLVKNSRQSLIVGPTDSGTTLYRDDVSEEVMNTELELIRSHEVLTEVVRSLGLDRELLAEGKTPAEALELALHPLSTSLGTEALRKANLLQVTYTSPDPRMANAVLQKVADAYLARHLALHSTPGTYELFKTQAAESSQQLRQAEEELASMARSANLVMLDKQKDEALTMLTAAQTTYAGLSAEMKELTARLRAAERKKLEVPPRLVTGRRNIPNQYSAERLNTLIVELRNKRTALLTKFNPDDRLIQELDAQITDTQAALDDATNLNVDETTTDVNPAWAQLESDAISAQLALAGLTGKAFELRQQVSMFRTRAQELAEAGPRYEQLVRRIAQARLKYELYVKKEEEARIAGALDQERISNVVLAQAPYVATVPSSPNLRAGLVVSGSIATVLAACAVIFTEQVATLPVVLRRRRAVSVEGDVSPVLS